jgi:hypothetical protein
MGKGQGAHDLVAVEPVVKQAGGAARRRLLATPFCQRNHQEALRQARDVDGGPHEGQRLCPPRQGRQCRDACMLASAISAMPPKHASCRVPQTCTAVRNIQ